MAQVYCDASVTSKSLKTIRLMVLGDESVGEETFPKAWLVLFLYTYKKESPL